MNLIIIFIIVLLSSSSSSSSYFHIITSTDPIDLFSTPCSPVIWHTSYSYSSLEHPLTRRKYSSISL